MNHQVASMDVPIAWSPDEYASFATVPMVSRHGYDQLSMFDRDALIDLLDHYPRKWLQAFTMGEDPTKPEQWKCVDIPDYADGEFLWETTANGRLWLNVTNIEKHDKVLRDLIDRMYDHLGEHCPHLKFPTANYSTLLISSPQAQVYYHVDAEPNMLWHLRGEKKVWIYPAMQPRLTPPHLLEKIYSGEIDENLPYDPSFDDDAQSFLLSPGDVASWPHNAPHRIVNLGMNVSLATSFHTPVVYKRQYTLLANRFLMRGLGFRSPSVKEDGLIPAAKRLTYRLSNKIRPYTRKDRSADYITDLQMDRDSPFGVRQLDQAQPASFSVLRN